MKVLGVLLFVLFAAAKSPDDDQNLRYNPATVVAVTGFVEDIREVANPPAVRGIHFFIKPESGGGSVDAYLGPAWFVQDFVANLSDRTCVHVTGSKVKAGNAGLVLAREVRKGGMTLYLRDKDGRPLWTESTRRMRSCGAVSAD
jgi:hypothetical protein